VLSFVVTNLSKFVYLFTNISLAYVRKTPHYTNSTYNGFFLLLFIFKKKWVGCDVEIMWTTACVLIRQNNNSSIQKNLFEWLWMHSTAFFIVTFFCIGVGQIKFKRCLVV